jgi:uncharacterized membrane protein
MFLLVVVACTQPDVNTSGSTGGSTGGSRFTNTSRPNVTLSRSRFGSISGTVLFKVVVNSTVTSFGTNLSGGSASVHAPVLYLTTDSHSAGPASTETSNTEVEGTKNLVNTGYGNYTGYYIYTGSSTSDADQLAGAVALTQTIVNGLASTATFTIFVTAGALKSGSLTQGTTYYIGAGLMNNEVYDGTSSSDALCCRISKLSWGSFIYTERTLPSVTVTLTPSPPYVTKP